MRWIYLSPHLDDAVFSAGGPIYEQTRTGLSVEIWTFMCGFVSESEVSPFAQLIHTQWGFSSAQETIRLRREEDRRAAALLGAEPVHFDFPDCIYRRGPDGEWLYSAVFIPPHPADAQIPAEIAQTLSAHLQPEDVLVCPLGLGSHVDHVLLRQGAEGLGRPLLYYPDIPYFFKNPEELGAKTAGMRAGLSAVTEAGLRRWQEAALEYKSQISTLGEPFDTSEKVRASLRAYVEEPGGARLFGTD